MLLDKDLNYRTYPERVLSVITSTAQKTYDYSATNGVLDDKVGAGLISLEGMLNSTIYQNKGCLHAIRGVDVISKDVYLPANTIVQIALAWLVTVNQNQQQVYVTDYGMEIYDSSGDRVGISRVYDITNIEMIRLSITESDTYTIVVFPYEDKDENVSYDWMSLTCSY